MSEKPTLAVWKFSSCDGCQLSILDCEDELLAIADAIDIANFPEASREVKPGPYTISLVEGSITTPHDKQRIHEIRKQSEILISIGACAVSGGIQALRNFADIQGFIEAVYASPHYIDTLAESTAIADHIDVDFELRGCPVDKGQLVELITCLLQGHLPSFSRESVCVSCKRRGNICTMVTSGQPCLGPVTNEGCNALCPAYNRACFGCFGPKAEPNTQALANYCTGKMGVTSPDMVRLLRTFNAGAPEFKSESHRHENYQDH